MSTLAILLFFGFATALVSGHALLSGYKQGNYNQGGGGQSGWGNEGHWDNKWSYLNTQQHPCFEPIPVDPSNVTWFFSEADSTDLSVPFSNYHFKLSMAEIFLKRPVHSLWELNQMNLKGRFDLEFANYYLVTYTGFGNKQFVINCTLIEVSGSSGSCVAVPDNSHDTDVSIIDISSDWVVYQNETLGIVVGIRCLGGMETGTADWNIYSLYNDEIPQDILHDIYNIVTVQYGLSWIYRVFV